MERIAYTLIDPQNGNLAFKVHSFRDNSAFDHLQRNNYFTVILITEGAGQLKSNFSTVPFSGKGMCCFSPYQPYMINSENRTEGVAIHFHPDFFCIYRHQNEVASNGVLFNNVYHAPFFSISDEECIEFLDRIREMKNEMQKKEIAQHELLILHLKIYLINAIRIKTKQQDHVNEELSKAKNSFVLQNLQDAIETNYKTKHRAGDYAGMLMVSGKTLARLTKAHFNKTLTDLISERIIIEAKRELYLTSKPVKEIAYTLGFADEYYFSRFFKKNAEISPQIYRENVGVGREALLLASDS